MVLKIGRQGSEIVKSGSLKLPGGGLRSLTFEVFDSYSGSDIEARSQSRHQVSKPSIEPSVCDSSIVQGFR